MSISTTVFNHKEKHPTGQMWKNYRYKNGKLHGECTEYNMLGNLSSVKHWLLGTKNRKWWIYYSNGSTKETFIYKMGVLNGKALKYYPNGQILSDKSYKSDKLS